MLFQAFSIFMTTNLKCTVQGFAESLQQECSKPAEIESCIAVVQAYCSGHYSSKIRKGLGSWVFKVLLQRFCKTLYKSRGLSVASFAISIDRHIK